MLLCVLQVNTDVATFRWKGVSQSKGAECLIINNDNHTLHKLLIFYDVTDQVLRSALFRDFTQRSFLPAFRKNI